MAKQAIYIALVLAVLGLVGAFGWPTRYRYESFPPVFLVRIDRFTGDIDAVQIDLSGDPHVPSGWTRIVDGRHPEWRSREERELLQKLLRIDERKSPDLEQGPGHR